ncbi:MAG: acylphosphatase [Ginsengibacter sp.]
MDSVSAYIKISGKVHGVFFRATAKEIAEKNNLTGWVKNVSDGNVEVIVSGNKDNIEKFIEWCKDGPERAEVRNINVTYIDEKMFKEFKVIRG